tara:strand:- start:1040 stop:1492 length:453 start_codon:yes stop_codon:yes gene_type:complete
VLSDGVFRAHPDYHSFSSEVLGIMPKHKISLVESNWFLLGGMVFNQVKFSLPSEEMAFFYQILDWGLIGRVPGAFYDVYRRGLVHAVEEDATSNGIQNVNVIPRGSQDFKFWESIGYEPMQIPGNTEPSEIYTKSRDRFCQGFANGPGGN